MRCAVYTRVSTAKEEQKASLINQKELFIRYIAERGWDLHEIYVDVETGTKARKRPQFQQMIVDAEDKKFDIILAKELSRIARNGELSYKVKNMAMTNNIHVVTLDGAIDTLKDSTQMFGLYAWMYEQESQRTSERVKYALDNRARNGLYKGSHPPYGYDNKDGKLYVRKDNIPDIVRRIYREYMSGLGEDTIARHLWEEGIPTPSQVARKNNASSTWHGSTVKVILQNPHYTGDLVQSRETTKNVTLEKRNKNPKDNWIIVENTHEAIISKEDFKAVEELIKSRRKLKKVVTQTHLFSNVAFCADCGHGVHFKRNRKGYVCGSYDKLGKKACSSHIIREKELVYIILSDIKKLVESVKNKKFINDIEKKVLQHKKRDEKELQKINSKIDELSKTKSNALRKLINDVITKEMYDSIVADDTTKLAELTKKQQEYTTLIAQYDIRNCISDIAKLEEQVLNITELTTDTLNRFVERIEIKSDGTPKIFYRFSGSSVYFSTLINFETHST